VRLRFEQRRWIIEPNINVTCHDKQQHSRRDSVGILPDRQSRG
jgi:hypothetical protein